MNIEPVVLKYLKGDSFHKSLIVDIGKTKHCIISRESAITEIIKNKDVIHIGCSDHIQHIDEKIKNNMWLHKLISDNARSCIGIDIDKESIEFIKNKIGYTNVFHWDILGDVFDNITAKNWDYVVLGEIIEHLDNPVNFLKVFKMKYGKNIDKFIITVPNIYNKRQFGNMMNYMEVINSDHRFWFTPYTISKILVSAGYIPEKISYANLQSLNKWELSVRKIKRAAGMEVKYPFYYFNTIIISGSISC